MRPVITIVTVCFNSENSIEQTIKSVLEQSCESYEYLLIDGGSTDKTLDIIKEYEGKFHGKMRYISERDNGWYDAMNKGIVLAEGSFINFLNSDDFLEKGALEKVCWFIKKNKINDSCIVYGDSTNIYRDSHGKELYLRVHAPEKIDCHCGRLPDGMCGIRHQSMFTGKVVFQKVGMLDLQFRIHADWDFFIKCLKKGIPFYYLNENLTFYSMYGVSTRPDYKERHLVRKSNKLYKHIDIFLWKDRFGFKVIARKILGDSRWNDLLFLYHRCRFEFEKRSG